MKTKNYIVIAVVAIAGIMLLTGCYRKKDVKDPVDWVDYHLFGNTEELDVSATIALCVVLAGIVGGIVSGICDSDKKTKSTKKDNGKENKSKITDHGDAIKETKRTKIGKRKKHKITGLGDAALIIDGNNVVWQDDRYGWRVLKTLLDWIKDNGIDYHLYFDASIAKEEKKLDEEMDASGKSFIEGLIADTDHTTKCPSRDEADKFILYRADKTGGHVISNDGYRPWEAKYPWIGAMNHTEEIRRIHKFTVEGNMLSVPDLDIFEKIVGS